MKEYIVDIWETRKQKLYGDSCLSQLQPQSSAGNLGDITGVEGQRDGKLGRTGKLCVQGKLYTKDCDVSRMSMCITSSAHVCGCVVNGRVAMAAV